MAAPPPNTDFAPKVPNPPRVISAILMPCPIFRFNRKSVATKLARQITSQTWLNRGLFTCTMTRPCQLTRRHQQKLASQLTRRAQSVAGQTYPAKLFPVLLQSKFTRRLRPTTGPLRPPANRLGRRSSRPNCWPTKLTRQIVTTGPGLRAGKQNIGLVRPVNGPSRLILPTAILKTLLPFFVPSLVAGSPQLLATQFYSLFCQDCGAVFHVRNSVRKHHLLSGPFLTISTTTQPELP